MKYTAYEIKVDFDSAVSEGVGLPTKATMTPITKKSDLARLVKEGPEKIVLQLLPSVGGMDEAYQGPLISAPKDANYIVIGTENLRPPSNAFEAMMQSEMGSVKKTFSALILWSEKTKKWRVAS